MPSSFAACTPESIRATRKPPLASRLAVSSAKLASRFVFQVSVGVVASIVGMALVSNLKTGGTLPATGQASTDLKMGTRLSSGAGTNGTSQTRSLMYGPEHLAALSSLENFRPLPAVSVPEAVRTAKVDAAENAAAKSTVTTVKSIAAVLPPPRPAQFAMAPVSALPEGPLPVTTPRQPAPAVKMKIAGVEMPGFVSSGRDMVRGVNDGVGKTVSNVGSSVVQVTGQVTSEVTGQIASLGGSLGRMMGISR